MLSQRHYNETASPDPVWALSHRDSHAPNDIARIPHRRTSPSLARYLVIFDTLRQNEGQENNEIVQLPWHHKCRHRSLDYS